MDDLELIKANVIYEGAAAFYAMEDIKQAEILLKAAKKYY